MSLLPGRAIVRLLRMGSGFGGVLSFVGHPHRDGSTGCPGCDATEFEPVRFERWVRCVGCRTVYIQRRATSLGAAFGAAIGDAREGSRRG